MVRKKVPLSQQSRLFSWHGSGARAVAAQTMDTAFTAGRLAHTTPCSHNGSYLDALAESLGAVIVAEHTVSSSAPSTGAVQDPRVSQVRPFAEVSTKRLFSSLTNAAAEKETNRGDETFGTARARGGCNRAEFAIA